VTLVVWVKNAIIVCRAFRKEVDTIDKAKRYVVSYQGLSCLGGVG